MASPVGGRYLSLGGQLSGLQKELIYNAILKMPLNSKVLIATDADEAGDAIATSLQEGFNQVSRSNLSFERARPLGKDWNEVLMSKNSNE
jgi:5S rRNA maturation endonuclease (ribonuclease M5)